MKNNLINSLNSLGIVMVVMTFMISMDFFSKDVLEGLRLVIMSLYIYTALALPWALKANKKTKLISLLSMVVYPIGIFNIHYAYLTAFVVFYSIYLFVSHNFLEDIKPI